ncbi:MAG: sugar transporter substrate-binding protein [Acidimicrobiales bacterium]|nr:sugar transporter substrate-binding protein [Acidimicrobiales bacterium]
MQHSDSGLPRGGPLMTDVRRRRPHARRVVGATVAAGLLALPACGGGSSGGVPTINWYAKEEAGGSMSDAAKACTASAHGRYRIKQVPLPTTTDEQREQLVRRLAAKDSSIDLLNMDVIWTAEFANAGWITRWPTARAEQVTKGKFPNVVDSARFKNQLYAAPLNGNTQLLWYRSDLVTTPPKTWDEMISQAEQLAREGKPHRIQVQGQRFEGLVVWFTSLLASAGGTVLSPDGTKVALPAGPTRRALAVMRRMSRSVAADPGLSTSQEDQGRQGWETGESAFMVNYGFVWPSASKNNPELAKKMRWAPYPTVDPGRPSKATIGGFNIGVGAYSKKRELAFDAATCLSSKENQLGFAAKSGLLPVTTSLYDDPKVTEATSDAVDAAGKPTQVKSFPYAKAIREALATAVLRPKTPYYNDVSLAITRTLHPTRDINPDKDVKRLRDAITKALKGEGLL